MEYRHELKHAISQADCLLLRQRLKYLMQADPNADAEGGYVIRSLYFDNFADKALREKIEGVARREKFRLRFYNNDTQFLRLEKKSKNNGLNKKESVVLTPDETQAILRCDLAALKVSQKPLLLELRRKMQTQQLRPKTIVEYRREAFIYPAGNVRVTLDTELKTGLYATNFFDASAVRITPNEAVNLLEVKYDAFIPEHIVRLLQLSGRQKGSFSKYAACRVYG